jgi:hypothetical protein
VLAEVDPHQRDVAAVRRVRVTGRLRKPRGEAYDNEWVVVRDSRPETLRTWHSTEQDLFAHPTEGWLLHPRGQLNAITDADARFDLPVAPGRNWIVVGQHGEFGTHEFVAPEGGIDLGDIVVEPPKPTRPGNATLRGLVLDCAGRPRAGAQVELGDGNLGATSHYVRTDDQGRFACEGLKSERVVARAVTMPRKNGMFGGLSGVAHLPEQDSGTIRLPCNTPVTLTAPAREEILWVKPPHRGFYLFVRNGVCVGGSPLDTIDEFGLPPGNYHIVAVTDDGRILEGDRTVTEGGELRLEETDFRDTTHG